MSDCCTCSALKPRYKRLVDNIFPANPEDGLVKSSMDKLTFFAMKSPDKLNKIALYLAKRLSRDVSRQRIGFVHIAMEALDSLLLSCHAQSLNMFVESFLKMVQKLLECNEPDLQCLATSSFVKFANIEEDTPSYHRRYDFFVSKFSSMCHNNLGEVDVQAKLRTAGVLGLQGVVRKTVSDDLQVNIWERTHMDKIVPSLLYNMQATRSTAVDLESPKDEEHPSMLAEAVFRDLVCRASYGNINAVIKPVLVHLDAHKLWVPNDFAIKCFKIIMYSVQAQYGYMVVQMLMKHLDSKNKEKARIKASIVHVLSKTVTIAAGGSIGPSVLEVFNTLLRHLRVSVDMDMGGDAQTMADEKNFQEAIINTIGEFANNLPDYQKIEIMMFIMGKMPPRGGDQNKAKTTTKEVTLQTMLMKTLLKVATKYKTVLLTNAFPEAFLEPLLTMSLVPDSGIRRLVQEIVHTLLDRHNNLAKLSTVSLPKDIDELQLSIDTSTRQDVMFVKKNGPLFYWHLYENLKQADNKVGNFECLYCTMVLICVEMGSEELLPELMRFSLNIQSMARQSDLPITHKSAIHALLAAHLNLASQLLVVPALRKHIAQVISLREAEAPFYLPASAFNRSNTGKSYPVANFDDEKMMFSEELIRTVLKNAGHETNLISTPYTHQPLMFAWLEVINLSEIDLSAQHTVEPAQALSDNISYSSVTIESRASTPDSIRRAVADEVTFESLKKVLEANPYTNEAELNQQQTTNKADTFEEIIATSEAKSDHLQTKLAEILQLITPDQRSGPAPKLDEKHLSSFDISFPELFVY